MTYHLERTNLTDGQTNLVCRGSIVSLKCRVWLLKLTQKKEDVSVPDLTLRQKIIDLPECLSNILLKLYFYLGNGLAEPYFFKLIISKCYAPKHK